MTDTATAAINSPPVGPYVLPPLRFAYDALEPFIDAETMRLHHDKHHRGYVDKVNAALAKHPEWLGLTIEDVLRRVQELPEDIRQTVRNQGGGHANHQFFWKILTPNAPPGPSGALQAAIEKQWGTVEAFKTAFAAASLTLFGSGWTFLVARPTQGFKLEILTLPNQESVLEQEQPAPGLLTCDLWEHAYYLKHHQDRAAWLENWWRVVHWDYVGERLAGVHAGKKQL